MSSIGSWGNIEQILILIMPVNTQENNNAAKLESHDSSPFTGENKFILQYRAIGHALISYERSARAIPIRPERLVTELRANLSFVQIEMLESYLDDLLDLEIADEKLYIGRNFILNRSVPIALVGLFASVVTGMYLTGEGIALMLSSVISTALALPFLILFYFSPRGALARRIMFAQILSLEVSRRRGRGRGESPRGFSPSVIVGGLFQGKLTHS